ncbi:MAG: hypothetical protein IPK26_30715 [Planctomycetes bacterium]|nr:hypothetical protein [Planctomycetota bacterium]
MIERRLSASVRDRERGSVMPLVLVATMSVGALAMAHLTKVMAELKKVRARVYAERAVEAALADLEIAKNVVNAALYDLDGNTALLAAMSTTDGAGRHVLPGSSATVQVEELGEEWYLLRATGVYQGVRKVAQATVRARLPVTNYNYFVIEHKLGISGEPRGKIHSNDKVDFYFPGGRYRDDVTACNGFGYRAGATADNTELLGRHDDATARKDILHAATVADVAAKADTLRVDAELIAEVTFQGTSTKVDLFVPKHNEQVPYPSWEQVFDHYETRTWDEQVAIYRSEQVTVTVPDYEYRQVTGTRNVPVWGTRQELVTVTRQRWVQDAGSGGGGGGDVSGGGSTPGHWESYTEQELQTVRYIDHYETQSYTTTEAVQVGSHEEQRAQQVFDHYETVTRTAQVPVYTWQWVTRYRTVTIPEQFLETRTVATTGILYFAGPIRKIGGEVNGKVTIATNQGVRLTDSIRYVDNEGDTRMLNGLDSNQDYLPNPDYRGSSVLAVMARDDIRYAVDCPPSIEINAALITTEGTVAFEGLRIASDGETVTHRRASGYSTTDYQKESIRRLGGIVSRERPVATYIDGNNNLVAGFRRGRSTMDRNMMLDTGGGIIPPGVLAEDKPLWGVGMAGRIWQATDIRGGGQ